MAGIISVRLIYSDKSKSLTEDWPVADGNPSPEVIKDCEEQTLQKWIANGGSMRNLNIHTKVRRA